MFALSAKAPARSALRHEQLSGRELDVLRLLTTRLSKREIGSQLHVSGDTVSTHTRAIYRKLGAHSRAEAVSRARADGLI